MPFTGKTTKENSQSHGFGLQIIEETLRDHMGYSKWIDHTDTFESILMFAIDMQNDITPYKNYNTKIHNP